MGRKKLDLVLENVTVEAVAAEGKALAHIDGAVLFIPFAVPGDVVDVRVVKKKNNYMEGIVINMKKPSEMRLEPFCNHFGVCGGCKWQPLPYEEQLKAKQQQVWDQLVRIGHLQVPEISPIIGSERTQYYRNKLEFTFSDRKWFDNVEDIEGKTPGELCGVGFHVGRFFDKVLDIEHCYLQASPSNEIRLKLKELAVAQGLPFYNVREHSGYLRSLFVRTAEDGQTMVAVCFAYDHRESREKLLNSLLEALPGTITSLFYFINDKMNDSIGDLEPILFYGQDAIWEKMENLRFRIGPKSFYQTNAPQAYNLYKVAREFSGLQGDEIVYDLYTGTGTIAQFVSSKASKVIGIEYVEEAIADARLNAAGNGITNCEFFAGDMKDVLTSSFIAQHGRPDVMIVDPPRAGMHPDVVKTILEAAPKRIVYVSCNPASQARDLAMLVPSYEITAVQPVDMFPHTHHVENVCRLDKKC